MNEPIVGLFAALLLFSFVLHYGAYMLIRRLLDMVELKQENRGCHCCEAELTTEENTDLEEPASVKRQSGVDENEFCGRKCPKCNGHYGEITKAFLDDSGMPSFRITCQVCFHEWDSID